MSSLIEDIEKAKNKKTLLFGNIQFDHLKRSDSKEVLIGRIQLCLQMHLIFCVSYAGCILVSKVFFQLVEIMFFFTEMMFHRVTGRKCWRNLSEKISFFFLT